jgi:hypothetical protein
MEKPIEEWTEAELWAWAQKTAIECQGKIIAFYRKQMESQMIYSPDLIDPKDFENFGPARHVHFSDLEEAAEADRSVEARHQAAEIRKGLPYRMYDYHGTAFVIYNCSLCNTPVSVANTTGTSQWIISCPSCQTFIDCHDGFFEARKMWNDHQQRP